MNHVTDITSLAVVCPRGLRSQGSASALVRLAPPAGTVGSMRTPDTTPDVVERHEAGRSFTVGALGLLTLLLGAVPFLATLALVETRRAPLQELDRSVLETLNDALASHVRILEVASELGGGATACSPSSPWRSSGSSSDGSRPERRSSPAPGWGWPSCAGTS